MDFTHEFLPLLEKMLWPLFRLILVMVVGMVAAHLIEALHWTRFIARLALPLMRIGHLREVAAASFSMAFISPAASNALLAEAYTTGEISRRELAFANLFNSTPTFLVHLPTLMSMAFAFLGKYAFIYVGLTFTAAALRTSCTMVAGWLFLPPAPQGQRTAPVIPAKKDQPDLIRITLRHVKKRLFKLLLFTIPIYCLVFAMQQAGWFTIAEQFMARHIGIFPFLQPEAVGIVVLHLAAESGAAFAAASSLMATTSLHPPEIIMALLVGNIVSSPMRAFRHQLPSYAGFFTPALAFHLVVMNQACRVLSLAVVTFLYYTLAGT